MRGAPGDLPKGFAAGGGVCGGVRGAGRARRGRACSECPAQGGELGIESLFGGRCAGTRRLFEAGGFQAPDEFERLAQGEVLCGDAGAQRGAAGIGGRRGLGQGAGELLEFEFAAGESR